MGERRARRTLDLARAATGRGRRGLHGRRPRDHRRHAGLRQDHRDRRRAPRGWHRRGQLLVACRPGLPHPADDHETHRHRRPHRGRCAVHRGRAAALRGFRGRFGSGGAQRAVRPGLSRLRARSPAAPHLPRPRSTRCVSLASSAHSSAARWRPSVSVSTRRSSRSHRALQDAQATAELLLLFLARLAGAGHEHPRGDRAVLRARRAAQLPQDLADGGASRHQRRVRDARRPRGGALHRQGRQPAPPCARPLPAAPGVSRPPGAGAARSHRAPWRPARPSAPCSWRRGSSRDTSPPTTRTARACAPISTSSSAPTPSRASTRRRTCATTARCTPGPSARPASPGVSSTASPARTRCARARGCRAATTGTGTKRSPCPRAGTGACLAPCTRAPDGAYAAVVADVRRILEGDGDALDERLRARQEAMVRSLAFEQAGRLQAQRETLRRALRGVRRLRAALDEDAVLVYPARRRGWVALWGTRGGRVVAEREVGRGRSARKPHAASSRSSPPTRRVRRCPPPRSTRSSSCTHGS